MLTMENQAYQHQIHKLQEPPPVPPRSPNYVSANHCLACMYHCVILFLSLVLIKLNQW